MAHEARKGLIRIASNYIRLLSTLALGLIVVPLTISWLGDEAFGLIALLGANIGLASIFRQIIQQSLIRELGFAYHAGDETFRKNYRAICLLSLICAVLSLGSFTAVILLLPLLKIPEEFVNPAIWFIVGQGINTAAMILLAPMLNMYLVTERFIGYNIWFIGVRATNIISVIILGYMIGIQDPAQGLLLHGVLWSALGTLGFIIAAAYIYTKDHRLMINVRHVRRDALRDVFGTFSWNSAVQVAMNLHEQVPPLLLNVFVGPLANAAWGVGFRFVAYIRMATTGVQFGSDAVSARYAAGEDTEAARKQLQRLINIQTKLTTMVALPAGIIVFFYSWPLFHAWVGKSLRNYDEVMPLAVNITRIVSWAIAARAISDTWMIVLYGAGYVKDYAKWVVLGGVIAPVAATVLMFMLPVGLVPYAPPFMMTAVYVCIHFFGFPFVTAKCLHIAPMSLIFSIRKPLLASAVALGAALLVIELTAGMGMLGFGQAINEENAERIRWIPLVGSLAVFVLTYAACSFAFVMTPNERARLTGTIASRMRRR
jgi:O-antigen/teichoic acid export membrane protein